ncbi:MAG: winged helix-turn-helix transcriptional regulator [Selenomonas artemidis]|jgi:site-specific recombinase, phage integrase family
MAKAMEAADRCPMEVCLNILSGKWTLKLLWQISKGPVRFNELRRQLAPIATKTLARQLQTLEEQKMITRTVYPETPPKVEYALSALGMTIRPVLKELCTWGRHYQETISKKHMIDGTAAPPKD